MKIEIEKEEDGCWIAEIPDLPGVAVYGNSQNEAISKAEALACRPSLTPMIDVECLDGINRRVPFREKAFG